MANFLITAGATREYLDDVRFLTNASSGRMGYALAAAAADAGHRVCLVSAGVSGLAVPADVELVEVVSARDMLAAVEARWPRIDVAFGVAAVADYRPARRISGKPPKESGGYSLDLVPNPDIIGALGNSKSPGQVVVGFALESFEEDADDVNADSGWSAALGRGRDKMRRKGLDLLAVNGLSAMNQVQSSVVLLWADGRREDLPTQGKDRTARRLVDAALALHRDPRLRGGSDASR